MRILVTGASGLLGRAVVKVLKEAGHDVVGTALTRVKEGLIKLDLEDKKQIAEVIGKERFDAVIHSAAERRPDECEADVERTRRINVHSTEALGDAAKLAGSWVLYISTDYVFDGKKPPYSPGDAKNPPNIYGVSKSDGEDVLVKATGGDCGILRVPVLYGPVEKIGESSVTVLTKMVFPRVKEGIEADDWQIRYPTHVADVAHAIQGLVEARAKRGGAVKGTFHFSGNQAFTKYELVKMIADILEIAIPDGFIKANASEPPAGAAPRPRDTCLDCSTLKELLGDAFPSPTPTKDGLSKVLTALIPAAALKKKEGHSSSSAAAAAGFKPSTLTQTDHEVLQGPDDEIVEILGGDGRVMKTKRSAARLIVEANKFAAEGNMAKAVEKMNLAVKEDPSIENIDGEADKRLIGVLQTLIRNGESAKGKALLEQYYAKKLKSFKEGSWETITVVEAHVLFFKSVEDWEGMANWAKKAVDMCKQHRGVKTMEYAQALSNHGLAIAPLERHSEAEQCFKDSVATQESIKGRDCQEVAQTCHNLALLYRNTGRFSEAVPLYDRALSTWERLGLWMHIVVTGKDAAMNHRSAGDVESARKAMGKCMAEVKKAPGEMQAQISAQLKLGEFMESIGMGIGDAASVDLKGQEDKKAA